MKETSTSLNNFSLGTKLCLPAWWVHAYDECLASDGKADLVTKIQQSKLVPHFNFVELNSLAILIGQFQKQLLVNPGLTELQFNPAEYSRYNSFVAPKKKEQFEKLVYQLGSMQFLLDGKNAIPFFDRLEFKPRRVLTLQDVEEWASEVNFYVPESVKSWF